ncbi:3-deoxy-7-phosphoheptulonate synthase [Nocardia seriolae]|uniref:3-deoxy-7-phosphoheptulonate synthase n=1 Tax=Nocardia seriolae TaxID=37332 RepID=UPI000D13ABC3|nr:3-deoxy-7-phosphoheptulonate synthase [Nocardia seriolae]PSK26541.1 hypothetical protein C6575_36760 [Nocardia seriolae]QUN14650.1 3-deoxy-7-phosphoheptulonate synthase [Nocardia seriolae]
MINALLDLEHAPALQQPRWEDPAHVRRVRTQLAASPALIEIGDVQMLERLLARVAAGEASVVQAGDCAEDPAECTPIYIARKAGLVNMLADALTTATQRPVLRAGRIAGQFVKPRSNPIERVGDLELPVYRGHMVNSPEPALALRHPNPDRMLTGYLAARDALTHLGWVAADRAADTGSRIWTSHEALLLDYEIPMLRRDGEGRLWLASTHWPWIGERTRQADGAHVALLSAVVNPVACKVGPCMTVDELLVS